MSIPDRFAGAVDLAAIAKQAGAAAQAGASSASQAGAAGSDDQPNTPSVIKVPSLIWTINETNLRTILNLSNAVPVLVEFHSITSASSLSLSPKLQQLINELAGRMVLARVNVDEQPQIAAAFKVQMVPEVVALLGGQPVPLMNADAELPQIVAIVNQVLKVAVENGIQGTVQSADPDGEAPEPQLPPKHQAAYDAINAGEYDQAIAAYQDALRDNPGDIMASRGLAQVQLLKRSQEIDFEKVLAKPADSFEAALEQSDALVATGQFEAGFKVLLDRFAIDFDNREALRKHLLELFVVAGQESPEVNTARARLASLLY